MSKPAPETSTPVPADPATRGEVLLANEAELAQSRLAAIVESSDDAIISKTLDGTITSWNQGAEKIFGYTAAEAVGRSITLIVPDDRLGEEMDVLARLRRGQKIDHFETIRKAKDGRLLDISVTVSPVKDSRGTVVGASKVARDVTDRKLVEAERQRWLSREQVARREAERALQARDEFLAMVSHELRSPLNAIVGWAHLLQTGELDAGRVERAVDAIARNAKIQSQLISDLLDAQSLASGKVRLNVQPTDLALVVEAALDTIRPSAEAKKVRLRPRLHVLNAVVPGDADRLQQIIWNLLSNAVKFTPEDGEIAITLTESDTHVELSVQDTGPGIRPEFLPFVFERFRQDSATGARTAGLGLGLSIVRHLVELHGGTVAATTANPRARSSWCACRG